MNRELTQTGRIFHSAHNRDVNQIAEYNYDDVALTSSLIREYVWMNGQVVAVIESGAVYYVRTDHIGRPVFATDILGTVVWEASYLPFGGVHSSTGSNINLCFPGQWFQAEAGLHQNWMRDYDPTIGRYIQADPLGLVDGASVNGYALQNPGRYVDPRGEFGIVGAAIGAISNLGAQVVAGGLRYGFNPEGLQKAVRCVDFSKVAITVAFGGLGGSPWKVIKAGGSKRAAAEVQG